MRGGERSVRRAGLPALAALVVVLVACGTAVDPGAIEVASSDDATTLLPDGGGGAGGAPAPDDGAEDDGAPSAGDTAPVAPPPSSPAPAPAPARPAPAAPPEGELEVHFLDVGQADAALVLHREARILIDTGDHRRDDVSAALRALDVDRLDLVIVSHPHADHLGQFDRVLGSVVVDEVWWSGSVTTTRTFERALAALEASTADYQEPRTGDRAMVGPVLLEVLHPADGAPLGDLHDAMLVVRLTYGDVRFLFTGDAETPVEARMLRGPAGVRADVLKVGHHGSRTSTSSAFLDAVAPSVAVYSAGAGNRYGHPHDEVVERIEGAGIALFGTDRVGTVVVSTDGRSLTVRTER